MVNRVEKNITFYTDNSKVFGRVNQQSLRGTFLESKHGHQIDCLNWTYGSAASFSLVATTHVTRTTCLIAIHCQTWYLRQVLKIELGVLTEYSIRLYSPYWWWWSLFLGSSARKCNGGLGQPSCVFAHPSCLPSPDFSRYPFKAGSILAELTYRVMNH